MEMPDLFSGGSIADRLSSSGTTTTASKTATNTRSLFSFTAPTITSNQLTYQAPVTTATPLRTGSLTYTAPPVTVSRLAPATSELPYGMTLCPSGAQPQQKKGAWLCPGECADSSAARPVTNGYLTMADGSKVKRYTGDWTCTTRTSDSQPVDEVRMDRDTGQLIDGNGEVYNGDGMLDDGSGDGDYIYSDDGVVAEEPTIPWLWVGLGAAALVVGGYLLYTKPWE